MSLQPRDYRQAAAAAKTNIQIYLDQHPDSFEILLFLPLLAAPETVAVNADVVGALDADERHMTYSDPLPAKAIRLPSPFSIALVDDGDDLTDGDAGEPVILMISEGNVPKQSIVQYEEFIDEERTQIVNYYVQSSEAVSSAPGAYKKHYCIPMRAFADAEGNVP